MPSRGLGQCRVAPPIQRERPAEPAWHDVVLPSQFFAVQMHATIERPRREAEAGVSNLSVRAAAYGGLC